MVCENKNLGPLPPSGQRPKTSIDRPTATYAGTGISVGASVITAGADSAAAFAAANSR